MASRIFSECIHSPSSGPGSPIRRAASYSPLYDGICRAVAGEPGDDRADQRGTAARASTRRCCSPRFTTCCLTASTIRWPRSTRAHRMPIRVRCSSTSVSATAVCSGVVLATRHIQYQRGRPVGGARSCAHHGRGRARFAARTGRRRVQRGPQPALRQIPARLRAGRHHRTVPTRPFASRAKSSADSRRSLRPCPRSRPRRHRSRSRGCDRR